MLMAADEIWKFVTALQYPASRGVVGVVMGRLKTNTHTHRGQKKPFEKYCTVINIAHAHG